MTKSIEEIRSVLNDLSRSDILKVYSGKPGCACGCNGIYRIAPENRVEADADRGYAYEDDEVNPRHVMSVLKKMRSIAERGEGEWCTDGEWYFINVEIYNRSYTVYLNRDAQAKVLAHPPTVTA